MTRIIKLIVSLFYYLYLHLTRQLTLLLGKKPRPICITLYYHSIYKDEISTFKKQLNLVKEKSNVIKSDFTGNLEFNKIYTIITFDDGFENLVYNAVPQLIDYNLPFTIFFISDFFGKKPNWEFEEDNSDQNEKIMTIDQMNSIPKNLLTIGSHTKSHKKLTEISHDELLTELIESKNYLKQLTMTDINMLSFPNGEYNSNVISQSFQAGYKRVFTIEPKFSLIEKDEKITGRVWANGNDWYIEFWLKIQGGYCWLQSGFNVKKKIMKFISK